MYTIDFTSLDDNQHLAALIQNMNSGYKYWEFYTNIVPFIVRHAHKQLIKDDMNLINIFEKMNLMEFLIQRLIKEKKIMTTYNL